MRQPFILLEDLEAGSAKLYERPTEILTASTVAEMDAALIRADERIAAGQHIAGWLGYEAGYALEPRLHCHIEDRWDRSALLGLFACDAPASMAVEAVDPWLAEKIDREAHLDDLRPAISFDDYAAAFRRVKDGIAAGDIYQANLTFPLRGRWHGDPLALYRAIRPEAQARFGGLVFDGHDWLLSFSPELFFSLRGDRIGVRPMKGTRPRGADPGSDADYVRELAESVKDRAENLMIVDLMRNDLSRISRSGTVRVDELFRVERYPTLFQMTTGVSSRLDGAPSMSRIMRAMFPCGSITGAPKVRAMEIIHDVETWRRGPYCGAIGAFAGPAADSSGDECGWEARFNVAIRTLRLKPGSDGQSGEAIFGVGSGIVADSVLEEEWEECLLKARFIARGLTRKLTRQAPLSGAA